MIERLLAVCGSRARAERWRTPGSGRALLSGRRRLCLATWWLASRRWLPAEGASGQRAPEALRLVLARPGRFLVARFLEAFLGAGLPGRAARVV